MNKKLEFHSTAELESESDPVASISTLTPGSCCATTLCWGETDLAPFQEMEFDLISESAG